MIAWLPMRELQPASLSRQPETHFYRSLTIGDERWSAVSLSLTLHQPLTVSMRSSSVRSGM
jgi:hypothetical protein